MLEGAGRSGEAAVGGEVVVWMEGEGEEEEAGVEGREERSLVEEREGN